MNDGVSSFLESRGIRCAEGTHDDRPELETVAGLGNRKNELVLSMIHDQGVEAYEGSVRYAAPCSMPGCAAPSSRRARTAAELLAAAGIADLFELRVDGLVAEREHLRGKPAPDTYLAAAERLGVQPSEAAVFEDALAGVAAGHAGGFRFVVGVDRVGQADALREHGADIVVLDLAELFG